MRDYEEEEILDSYSRLQNSKPLTIGEKVKALPTKYHEFIKQIADHKLFKIAAGRHKVRDAHWNLAALFFKSTFKGAPLDRQEYSRLEDFLKSTKLDTKRAQNSVDETRKILNYEHRVFDEALSIDSKFEVTLGSARTLKWVFAALSVLLKQFALSGREHLVAKGLLKYYEQKEIEGTDEWMAYVNTGRTGRIDTDEVRDCLVQLMNYVVLFSAADPIDKNRFFNAAQRREILAKSQSKCPECGIVLSESNFHADHIKPHSAGGKTDISNGQALCTKCNRKRAAEPNYSRSSQSTGGHPAGGAYVAFGAMCAIRGCSGGAEDTLCITSFPKADRNEREAFEKALQD